jgi:hypothetical protein
MVMKAFHLCGKETESGSSKDSGCENDTFGKTFFHFLQDQSQCPVTVRLKIVTTYSVDSATFNTANLFQKNLAAGTVKGILICKERRYLFCRRLY